MAKVPFIHSLGTDEWKSRCKLPPSGGKSHLQHLPMPDTAVALTLQNYATNFDNNRASMIIFRREVFSFYPVILSTKKPSAPTKAAISNLYCELAPPVRRFDGV